VKPTLVDSNVILDVATEDPTWAEWSEAALERASDEGPILVNPIIYAEVSVYAASMEDLDERLVDFEFLPLPKEAAFLAGKAHCRYKKNGGTRKSPLPDLFIGAHAMIMGCRILTRDARRFHTYFPRLELVAPE
jgi:predicted nucleic acid-binding protein